MSLLSNLPKASRLLERYLSKKVAISGNKVMEKGPNFNWIFPMETSYKIFDWIRIRIWFFPLISWSVEDEATEFQESHKLLLAIMKTLRLFKCCCLCHENLSASWCLDTAMSWKPLVQNSWLRSVLQRVTRALMWREPMGGFITRLQNIPAKPHEDWTLTGSDTPKQLDNLRTSQSREEEKLRAGFEIHDQHFKKHPSHQGVVLQPCPTRVLSTHVSN